MLQIIQNLLWNDRNSQKHKKLKYGQKRQKKLKNTFGMIFMAKYQKKSFWQEQAFLTKIFSKRFNCLICLHENDKYGETAQKLKVGLELFGQCFL